MGYGIGNGLVGVGSGELLLPELFMSFREEQGEKASCYAFDPIPLDWERISSKSTAL